MHYSYFPGSLLSKTDHTTFMIALLFLIIYCMCFLLPEKEYSLQSASYCTVLLFIQLALLNYSINTNCCLLVEKNVYNLLTVKQTMLVRHGGFSLSNKACIAIHDNFEPHSTDTSQ